VALPHLQVNTSVDQLPSVNGWSFCKGECDEQANAGREIGGALAAWVAWSVVYPVPQIRTGMTEQEVEAVVGKPGVRTHDEGHSEVGVYRAIPRWLLGRHDTYIVTYDHDGRVAHYDLFESGFGGSSWIHH